MSVPTPFFITCLPRSRSAWIANWLTTDRSICYHDTPFDRELLRTTKFVGFCGPELVEDFDVIRMDYPGSQWVAVVRDQNDALDSFVKWAGKLLPDEPATIQAFWEKRTKLLSRIATRIDVMWVSYNALNEMSTCMKLWDRVLPDLPFDRERWKILDKLNVQQDKGKAKTCLLAQ